MLNTPKTMKRFLGTSKIYKEQSMATTFVHDAGSFLMLTRKTDGASNGGLRSTDSESSPFVSGKMRL